MTNVYTDKGRGNCMGDVVLDANSIPGLIVVTCKCCSLRYTTPYLGRPPT